MSSNGRSYRSAHTWAPVSASTSCAAIRTRVPALRTLPSSRYRTPSSRPISFTFTARPLYVKLELRATTNSHLMRESPVMMSSTIPSAKYSWSWSPDRFANGSTATDALSGSARAGDAGVAAGSTRLPPSAALTGPM